MRSNDILTVRVDLENGEYVLSRYDGQQSLVKPINDGERKSYDKKYIAERRKQIIGRNVPKEKEKQIDVGLYDSLVEFDQTYGTEYAQKYIDITTETIFIKVSESKRDFRIRANTHKMAEFVQARMNIEYDLNIFKSAKNLSLRDRFQIFRQAFAQKLNGIQINVNKPKKAVTEPLLGPSQADKEFDELISTLREQNMKALEIEKEEIKEESPISSPIIGENEQEQMTSQEEQKITPESIEQKTSEKPIVAPEIVEPKVAEETIIEPDTTTSKPKPTYEPRPKKSISRAKSRQASKKAAREAGKMKNIYQTKIKDKTKPAKTEEQIQKEAQERRQAKAQKAAEVARIAKEQAAEQKRLKAEQERAEQERIAAEEQAKKDAKLSSRVKRIILGKKDSEGQEEHIVKRFTRKLKDQRDSIRNKVHIPSINKRTIAGAVGTVCVVAAIGLGIAGIYNNGNSMTEANQPIIESSYDLSTETQTPDELQSSEKIDYEDAIKQAIRFEENGQVQTETTTEEETISKTEEAPVVEENTEKEKTEQVQEENTEKVEEKQEETTVADSSIEYLSSVRVGASMNIESGKYFECPDGTGNYGYFENQQNGTKEISIIGVTTNNEYFAITDSNISLYDLKQQYPDAKFSYHFICRYEDGSTKMLGWLTENSMEQNRENSIQSIEDEER